jgi:hypothetical protein
VFEVQPSANSQSQSLPPRTPSGESAMELTIKERSQRNRKVRLRKGKMICPE